MKQRDKKLKKKLGRGVWGRDRGKKGKTFVSAKVNEKGIKITFFKFNNEQKKNFLEHDKFMKNFFIHHHGLQCSPNIDWFSFSRSIVSAKFSLSKLFLAFGLWWCKWRRLVNQALSSLTIDVCWCRLSIWLVMSQKALSWRVFHWMAPNVSIDFLEGRSHEIDSFSCSIST